MRTTLCFTTILLIVMTVATSPVGGVVIPTGLTDGDPYHLAFVTSGTRTGNSTDIAVYNTFVQDQAAMNSSLTGTNVGVTYTAIASTETVDASDNALVEAPIYLLDGTTKVADGFSDLWDGTLDAPLDLTQDAILCADCRPWTGTNFGGEAHQWFFLGLANFGSVYGDSDSSVGAWIRQGDTTDNNHTRAFYALSQKLIAPEPSSLIGFLALALVGIYRRGSRGGQRH